MLVPFKSSLLSYGSDESEESSDDESEDYPLLRGSARVWSRPPLKRPLTSAWPLYKSIGDSYVNIGCLGVIIYCDPLV